MKFAVESILTKDAARQSNPLVLAYIGDTVYDLYVRTKLVADERGHTGVLHRLSSKMVNAKAQAQVAHRVFDGMDEDEKDIFMRGRNAKSATVPKNMSVADYRYATALEAVVGYLFLTGQTAKIEDILKEAFDAQDQSES